MWVNVGDEAMANTTVKIPQDGLNKRTIAAHCYSISIHVCVALTEVQTQLGLQ